MLHNELVNISDAEFKEKLAEHKVRRENLVTRIYAVFAGVTREGGVSWSEADFLDGPPRKIADRLKYRANDNDENWESLVEDPKFKFGPGIGGLGFLDAVGFRYYLAPSMIRALRGEDRLDLEHFLRWRHDNPRTELVHRPGFRLQLSTAFPFILLVQDEDPTNWNRWYCFTDDQMSCVEEFEELIAESDQWGFQAYVSGHIP